MKYKLRANADYFNSEQDRIGEVYSRLGGQVSKRILPYFNGKHLETIETVNKLLEHLWNDYYNHTTKETAIR
ncbi:hypothetical protein QBC45DRAFT_337122 [Copromyces sp. CBS 386.78]|nr:hypothetical protein QBC45DRAFT_337122 [Copromyces sp. CBS 386.78]